MDNSGGLASAILASSQRLGISPRDLATAISYETAGTFDPWKAGPTTQWGQHRGLIQWGEPQRQKYGVYEGMPVDAQMGAVEKYLTDAGVKPGMGLLDVYSAINAGQVGKYGASDANNGGAPGTVADKVSMQMAGHMANADRLLGDGGAPMPAAAPAGQPMALPGATAPTPADPTMGLLSAGGDQTGGSDPFKALQGLLAQATPKQQSQPQQDDQQPGLLNRKSFPKLSLALPRRA